MLNGLFLVTSYIAARLVFGTYTSWTFWKLMVPGDAEKVLKERVEQAGWVRWVYLGLNLSANGLNFVSPRPFVPFLSEKSADGG